METTHFVSVAVWVMTRCYSRHEITVTAVVKTQTETIKNALMLLILYV
jgi:hypothetical protein